MLLLRFLEDDREFCEKKRLPVGFCECCESPLYEGDVVLVDNRFKRVRASICMECFLAADKVDLVEWLGGSFDEVC